MCRGRKRLGLEVALQVRPQVCALQAAEILSRNTLPGTRKDKTELSYRITTVDELPVEKPGAIWFTLPPELEALMPCTVRGRYLLDLAKSKDAVYIRESCRKIRFMREGSVCHVFTQDNKNSDQ